MSRKHVVQYLCDSFDDFAEQASSGQGPNNWEGLRADLLNWISAVEPGIAFDGLFEVLETRSRYQYQWLAGDLLLRASIRCRMELPEFVMRVAPGFNASADTVPKYLADVFGQRTTLETLQDLRRSESDDRCAAAIDSMLYGLAKHSE